MKNPSFTQIIETDLAEEIIKKIALEHKPTPFSELPRLVSVGNYGQFEIVVRASVDGFRNWRFDGGSQSGGGCNRRAGFKTVQEVIDFGVENCRAWYEKFYAELEDEDRRREERGLKPLE